MKDIHYLVINKKNGRFEIHFDNVQQLLDWLENYIRREGLPELIYRLG